MNNFYAKLSSYEEKSSWFNSENFISFDPSWYLIVSDVKGSTKAIEAGKYKDVNVAGALVIIAILNLQSEHELPFVFGGDGAVILIPPSLKDEAIRAIEGVLHIVEESFNLELRGAIIELRTLYAKNYHLEVLKYKVSDNFTQAIFTGNAIEHFEKDLKQGHYALLKANKVDVNLEGFECRWQDIYSPKDYTLSILLELKENSQMSYEALFAKVDDIFTSNRDPIAISNLHISTNLQDLRAEVKVKKGSIFRNLFENILGIFLIKFKMKTKETDWSLYKEDVASACDSEKFDGSLKLVISATKEELKTFRSYLKNNQNEIFYGIHQSDRALMTCLVYERNGAQVHFVDSADGGYALAAKELKAQKQNLILSH